MNKKRPCPKSSQCHPTLSKVLNGDATEVWLAMQAAHDLWQAQGGEGKQSSGRGEGI
jgi:hypothetical protein